MRFSQAFIYTLRENPQDAEVISHKLMARAGMIDKLAAGIYTYLPLGWRSIEKLCTIVREEMARAGSVELAMPCVQPAELWQESGRWFAYGKELLRFKDRHERDFCFGPTHEEVITDVVRRRVNSYRQLPVNLFQIQTKFRDEIRPRFGLMRGREFLMKDAYSFHSSYESLDEAYRAMEQAYRRIFERCGLSFTAVEADTGNIGGSESHEFMVLAETGEDAVVACACGYGANVEKAEAGRLPEAPPWPGQVPEKPQAVHTPGLTSVPEVAAFLGLLPAHFVKTMVVETDREFAVALVRGDDELNEVKLKNALGATHLQLASAEKVQRVTHATVGFAGPVGLSGVRVVADPEVMRLTVAATGANRDDFHLVGVVPGRDFNPDLVADIRLVRAQDPCPRCHKPLEVKRGIEVGHIFKLGTKYSKPMGCTYLDEKGEEQPMIMGCYGLGIGRTVAAAVEQNHDEDGIIWPLPLAPYAVEVLNVNPDLPQVGEVAERLYGELLAAGVEVLYDDRDERGGVKFKDADLIGFPVRVVVGKKGVEQGRVEISLRRDKSRRAVGIAEACGTVREILARGEVR
ncbi:prolyl-tRNA synthetase [Thermoanaerobaculum aquaticum]|uniref:Proline--tRNA ligase n=1 Tax=Thermoanaerobaculum aquaticum TaxID=1312852 RepID=A0A062XX20_9BACT|nr:proline--tRNA ligase [Thermoanaerobaculum aquaticum]KDA53060.1 prolyl-tRNA synthetase [Thermoanaerobaculum aquaticum]BCW93649.1 MAG: proline--tRNA ligase [Thermoanaerobaculum sp.]GBC79980.1 Proline--tRNA ligase [bacterium HR09]